MYRLVKIDPLTWLPLGEVGGFESASVKVDANRDGGSPLVQSCMVDVAGKPDEGYYRISKLGSDTSVEDIATCLLMPESSDWARGAWSSSVSGRSVLEEASKTYFSPGAYVPQGTDCIAWARGILADSIPAPVEAQGSFRLSEHVVFDLSASHLDGVWQVLDIAGFTMGIDPDGTVMIRPRPTEPALTVNTANRGIIGCEISCGLPMADVPNVMRVYVDGQEFVASNDDPASPTSTVARGRRIEAIEEDPVMKDGESPMVYAVRRLSELAEVYETYDVTRIGTRGVGVNDLIRVNLPEQGIEGDFTVMSQSIDCAGELMVSETWGRLA